jgi:hypothetical protein
MPKKTLISQNTKLVEEILIEFWMDIVLPKLIRFELEITTSTPYPRN